MDLTLREWTAFAAGVQRQEQEAWRRSLWAAWHGAAFARARRMPDLGRLMRRLGRRRAEAPKTPEQLLRVVEHLNALFGGLDHRRKK